MNKSTRVLIVDDEPQNTQIMREILSFHPRYDYRIAVSGEEALAELRSYYPDIILLDIMMPGIDGYEVCRQVRQMEVHKFSKIIMISGRSMVDDRLNGYQAGADDYITKPFVEDELVAKLDVYSKLSRMEEVDAFKTMALNILSHETRTPLNGIILGSELLSEVADLPPQASQYIAMVRESGLRLQELVARISRYCAIKEGITMSLKKVQLSAIIGEMRATRRSPEMYQWREDGDIYLYADVALVLEAISYLLDNAEKNSPPGGRITVRSFARESTVYLQVEDEGPGVDPALTQRVFDGLFSTDLLHHKKGAGLSLAIAKEIIEGHDGVISCYNRDHGGTVFEVKLARHI